MISSGVSPPAALPVADPRTASNLGPAGGPKPEPETHAQAAASLPVSAHPPPSGHVDSPAAAVAVAVPSALPECPAAVFLPQLDTGFGASGSTPLLPASPKSAGAKTAQLLGGSGGAGVPQPEGKRALRWVRSATLVAALGAVLVGCLLALGFIRTRSGTPHGACNFQEALSASASSGLAWGRARSLSRLEKPLVLLISSDGFRIDYHLKVPQNGNLSRLRAESTVAVDGMLPPFPSVTFPSHYSMATGLHPAWHGIVNNYFVDPTNRSSFFSVDSLDPHWWRGEPIWETVTKQGLLAATMFWPGTSVVKGPWDCPKERCFKAYNGSVAYEERVDTVLRWVALPPSQRPSLVTLYFEEPDHSGHQGGPDTPLITEALGRVDSAMGRLLHGLDSMGVLDDVSILMVSDHGMLSTCGERTLYLADLSSHVSGFSKAWVTFNSPFVGILPPAGRGVAEAYRELQEALGEITNGDQLSLFLKEDLDPRFLMSEADRIPPIVGVVSEGYQTLYDAHDSRSGKCLGMHGYDNELASMRGLFLGRGPRFSPGRPISPFSNVEIYNVIAAILGINPALNNGSSSFSEYILLPE